MPRTEFKPGNMLYPLPAVLVSVKGNDNLINLFTVAWAGTVCTNPPMVSISVRKERFSYNIIKETGEFVINLTTRELAFATDYCGVKSGRDTDKWKETGLTPIKSLKVNAPTISESPVAIECKVRQVLELGSHDMFIAEVVAVQISEKYMDKQFALGCEIDVLQYFGDSQADMARKIRWADIIFMPGGNSTFPVHICKKKEIDKYFREVFEEKETVLSGKCAGAMFWFEESYDNDGPDDSFEFINPLGLIPYCMCPHFDSPEWMSFEDLAKTRSLSSIAIENGAAISFLGDKREIFNVSGKEKVYLFDAENNYKKIDLTADSEALAKL